MVEFEVTVGLIIAKMVLQLIVITALMFGITHKDVLNLTQTFAINSVAVELLILS
jgi:hypothetical protein